jgi:hypothetical protein
VFFWNFGAVLTAPCLTGEVRGSERQAQGITRAARSEAVVLVKFRNLSVGHDLTFGAGMGFQGKGGS